jgi:sister chromatid cohesion protein PDS5
LTVEAFFFFVQVRQRFLSKLHKGLIRGVPFKCLPLDFMGIYALAGLEEDRSIKEMAKQFLIQVRKWTKYT